MTYPKLYSIYLRETINPKRSNLNKIAVSIVFFALSLCTLNFSAGSLKVPHQNPLKEAQRSGDASLRSVINN